jgi:hypothetical protein
MQQRIIPPPGYNQEHKPSEEEILMTRNIGLSNFWEHYADLIAKSDWEKAEAKARAAFSKAAEYLRKAIDFAEKDLDRTPKTTRNI